LESSIFAGFVKVKGEGGVANYTRWFLGVSFSAEYYPMGGLRFASPCAPRVASAMVRNRHATSRAIGHNFTFLSL